MPERNCKSHQYRVAGVIALAFLLTLGTGCRKSDKAAPAVASDSGLDDKPDGNPAKTRRYLDELRSHWTTTPTRVELECHQSVDDTTTKVHVDIYTHALTYKIDAALVLDRTNPENAQSPKGHIVVKFVNRDPVRCKEIGLEPMDSVYLWAGRTNKERAFALFRIDAQGSAIGVARALGGLHCIRPNEPTASDVHLTAPSTCELDATRKVDLYHDQGPEHSSGPLHNQGVWYACPGGCCQASNFGPYQ